MEDCKSTEELSSLAKQLQEKLTIFSVNQDSGDCILKCGSLSNVDSEIQGTSSRLMQKLQGERMVRSVPNSPNLNRCGVARPKRPSTPIPGELHRRRVLQRRREPFITDGNSSCNEEC